MALASAGGIVMTSSRTRRVSDRRSIEGWGHGFHTGWSTRRRGSGDGTPEERASQRGMAARRRMSWRRGADGAEQRSLEGTPTRGDKGGNISSAQRSAAMSRGLTYADLTAAEQWQYTTI